VIPEVPLAAQLLSASLVEPVGQFKDLMHEEGEEIQKEEVEGEMLHPMTEVVLDVVTLIFQGIEGLVLDLPPATAYSHEFFHSLVVHGDVGYPGVMVGSLPLVMEFVRDIVDGKGIIVAV
jgi:hypothetical protein